MYQKAFVLIVSQVSSSPQIPYAFDDVTWLEGQQGLTLICPLEMNLPLYICEAIFRDRLMCDERCFNLYIGPSTNGNNEWPEPYGGSSWRAKRIHIHTYKRKKQKNTWDDDDDDADARHWTRMCSWCINVFVQLNFKKMKHIDSISFILKVSPNVSTWPKRVCKRYGPFSSPQHKDQNSSTCLFCISVD
jgi:hypothetical protein